jgi:hypothetical protein
MGMINRLYAASRLLSATSSYKLQSPGMAAQETGYTSQAVGACVASYTELATAVCSWLCCLLAAQLHVATSSYKVQHARAFSVTASYKLQLRTGIRLQAKVFLM